MTTEINVYCSEDGNENNSPMSVIHKGVVIIILISYDVNPCHVDDTLQSANRILNVSMVNHFLRNNVTVTLQWPREAGAVYNVNILPLTEMNTAMSHDNFVINLTVSYNIQYNINIVSSLCGITTTKVLNYGK